MKLTRKEKNDRYAALPPAMMVRPLRFIKSRSKIVDGDGKVSGYTTNYVVAKQAALYGDGAFVKSIAWTLDSNYSYDVMS